MKNNIKTVKGKNVQDAINEAKKLYGDEFSLIQTKEINKDLVELVILLNKEEEKKKPVASNPYEKANNIAQKVNVTSPQATSKHIEEIKTKTKDLTDEINEILSGTSTSNDKAPQTNGLDPIISNISNTILKDEEPQKEQAREDYTNNQSTQEIEILQDNISNLTRTLKNLQSMYLEDRGYSNKDLTIPPEFSEVFRILKSSGISKRHLKEIFTTCIESMPIKMKQNPEAIERYFKTLLGNMILIKKEQSFGGKKRIIMLVGATGVGKTTSIAKIAARYCFSGNKKNSVGIITLDDYRLGALDQIMTYAKIMKLNIQAVVNPVEFVSAVQDLNKCDYILIDTAGSSPYNKAQIASIKRYLEEDEGLEIGISLVIAANTASDTMEDIYKNFSILDIDNLIITKLDETKKFGALFSFLFDHKKPISYVSIGQEVPDDFKEADRAYLVKHLFGD